MLNFFTGRQTKMCDRIHRRDFLRIGTLGLGGLTLADVMRSRALGQETPSVVRDKAVVLLFLAGGPSQIETFDPKPGGLEGSTSIAGHVPTRLPGVRFASYFPRLAQLADRLTVVRSFQTNHAEHNGAHKQFLTADLTVQDGKPIREPGLGAVCTRVMGAVNQTTGLPRHALIPPTTRYAGMRAGFAGAYDSVVEGCQPAWLGAAYSPFQLQVPMAAGEATVRNNRNNRNRNNRNEDVNPFLDSLQLHTSRPQMNERLDLLRQFDQLDQSLDNNGAMDGADHYRQQAVDLLLSGDVRRALDLNQEDPRVLARYDTEHFRNWNCDDNSHFIRNGPSIGISLGRQLLMARRLCEAGCGFVTAIHANWDFHARRGIPNMPEGMGVLAPPVDHAVSAFLEDVEQRGLSDKILLIITGEFGRTPRLDDNLGRHHWPRICPLVFAGGGLRHGQVIGQSDRRGGEPAGDAITIDDFHATIMHTLFDVAQMRLDVSMPRQIIDRATRGRPIHQLF